MFIFDSFEVIRDFLERGGNVLWLIFWTLILMWAFIAERFIYFRSEFPKELNEVIEKWTSRKDRSSWYAHKIRQAYIAKMKQRLFQNITVIKLLVALCPLMGLLGTVTGMIVVFDVMADTGTGNARMMASGISMATIPTMSGMVAALSGLYFGSLLETKANRETQKLADVLTLS